MDWTLLEKFVLMEIERHIEESTVESYATGSLSEEAAAGVEQHLLICAGCRDRVTEAESYIRAMKRATERMPAEPARSRWGFPFLMPAFAVCALLIVAVGIRFVDFSGNAPPAPVALFAMRGAAAGAQAPARRTLLLRPDLQGLPVAASYRLEVVDAAGSPAWHGTLSAGAQPPEAAMPGQAPGIYFVRVSLPSGELLREYTLKVEKQ